MTPVRDKLGGEPAGPQPPARHRFDSVIPESADALSAAAAARAERHSFAVVVVDMDETVVWWSPGAERQYGWTAREAIGAPLPTIPAQDGANLRAILASAAAGGMFSDLPAVWRRRDGSLVEVQLSLAPLVGANGRPAHVAIGARDPSATGVDDGQMEAYARDVRESYMREQRRARALEASYHSTVRALAAAVEAKDGYTGEHIHRVHDLGLVLARKVCPAEASDPQLAYGFLLHDIGKLSIPDAILQKPGRLTAEEFAAMRRHPEEGVRILLPVTFLDRALDVVRHHHERWDGGGYPDGLAGSDIPLWARIFAVVDTLDAMTSDRPYRAALPVDEALAEIERGAGSQFDPDCVDALMRLDRRALGRRLDREHGDLSRDGAT